MPASNLVYTISRTKKFPDGTYAVVVASVENPEKSTVHVGQPHYLRNLLRKRYGLSFVGQL